MDPINYSSDVASPFQSVMQGFQGGLGISNAVQQQQQQQLAMQAQRQMQQDLQTVASNPNATGQDYAGLMTKYPQLSEHLSKSWATLNGAQQQARLDQGTQVYAALQAGAPDVAEKLLRDSAAAKRNSGAEDQAKADETLAEMIKLHPETARTSVGLTLASKLGPDKFATTFSTLGDQGRAADKAPADLRKAEADATIKEAEAAVAPQAEQEKVRTSIWNNANTKSQINERAQRLGLDRDKLTTETQLKLTELNQKFGELPEFVAKDISSATGDALAADQSAARMTTLADQIDKAAGDLSGGVTAKAGEAWKKAFGSQNDLTRIRAEYNRIVTPAAMAAYKQVASGSTSDKDIETAMTGVPKDTDSAERMSSFLRGAAKLQVYDSVLNNAKSEWLGAVRNLGKSTKDIEVDGVKVPAGTTFKNFADQYVAKKVAERTAAQTVAGRSYMRFAAPPAGAASEPAATGFDDGYR